MRTARIVGGPRHGVAVNAVSEVLQEAVPCEPRSYSAEHASPLAPGFTRTRRYRLERNEHTDQLSYVAEVTDIRDWPDWPEWLEGLSAWVRR